MQAQNINQETSVISDALLLIIGLLVLNQLLLQQLSTTKSKYPKIRFLNDTIVTTLLGIITGYLLNTSGAQIMITMKMGFSQIFLIILLPPILFESAIHMDSVTFFEHFGTINMYAIFGTIISMIITSLILFVCGALGLAAELPLSKCFAYGAIISSTDPVAVLSAFKNMKQSKMLYTFIFGESILNDAVSLTLFNAVNDIIHKETDDLFQVIRQFLIVFFVSIAIGYAVGILSAFIIKFKSEAVANFEISLLLLLPWITYLISEALEMSGIVSIMFCGISMARYTMPHINENAKKEFTHFYEIVAHIFENSVFIMIGIGIIGFELPWRETGFGIIFITLIAITISRYFFVYIITKLANHYRTIHIISNAQLNMLSFSGLRGAMAYALSIQTILLYGKIGEILLTISLVVIMFNIFIQGALLEPILMKYENDLIENYVEVEELPQNFLKKIKQGISNIDNLFIDVCLATNNDEEIPLSNNIQQIANEINAVQVN